MDLKQRATVVGVKLARTYIQALRDEAERTGCGVSPAFALAAFAAGVTAMGKALNKAGAFGDWNAASREAVEAERGEA